ncbi:MAG: hypothetical protein WAW57_06380, partial [Lutibacter sp.]
LLLTAGIIASCENETEILPENAELDNQKIEATGTSSYKSVLEIFESGVDLKSYLSSLNDMKKMEIAQTAYQLDDFVPTDLEFFYSADDFPCSNLPTEDFEEGNIGASPDFIDENTDTGMFSPGDILSGVSIHTMNNYGSVVDNFYLTDPMGTSSKVLFVNYFVDYMIIDFTADNVRDANMDVFSIWGESEITIEIFGSSGFLGTTVVYGTNSGTYWGVKSNEPITRITLHSLSNQAEGIDNLSFGTCDDFDGDGVLNEDDAHPNSDMSEYINIDGCNPNVKNVLVKNGSTMMDQITDLIAQINSEYNGQNYKTLHSKFMTKLAQITYNWRTAKLITTTQRTKISSCAWGANIPYYFNV